LFRAWRGPGVADRYAQSTTVFTDTSKTLTAIFETSTVQLSIIVVGDGTVTTTPASVDLVFPRYTDVELVAAPANEYWAFAGWEGNVTNPATATTHIVMDANRTVRVTFVRNQYSLTLGKSGDGTVSANAVVDPVEPITFDAGSTVNLKAVAASGQIFTGWKDAAGGPADVADPAAAQTTVLMDADKIVIGTFAAAGDVNVSVTSDPIEGGTVTRWDGSPLEGSYPLGFTLDVLATAYPGYVFGGWRLTDLSKADSFDATNPKTVIYVDGPKALTAVFMKLMATPNEAWLFGGIVSEISLPTGVTAEGAFTNDTTVMFQSDMGGIQIPVPVLAWSANVLDVALPVLETAPAGATIPGKLVVTKPAAGVVPWTSGEVAFTYNRHKLVLDAASNTDVMYTAFVQAPGATSIDLAAEVVEMGAKVVESVGLAVPIPLAYRVDELYGLVRTTPVPAEAFWTNGEYISNTAEGRDPAVTEIPGLYDVDIHMYKAMLGWSDYLADPGVDPASDDYPLAEEFVPAPAAAFFEEIHWKYIREDDDLGPGRLGLPIPAETALTHEVMRRDGLSLWAWYDYDFDYAALQQDPLPNTPAVATFQSAVLGSDVMPEPTNENSGDLITDVDARFFEIGAFSLRKRSAPPEGFYANIKAKDEGDLLGRTLDNPMMIYSPDGGLGYNIRKVEFYWAPSSKDSATPPWSAEVTPKEPRTSEFKMEVPVPGISTEDADFERVGDNIELVVDLKLYLNNTNNDVVLVKNAYTYSTKAEPGGECCCLLGLLLGLALLILGAAADSGGGGGGGPCFIATAAYGTPMAADLDVLRALRDTYLLDNAVGTALVDAYYHVSPAIATVVAKSPVMAALVRLALTPIILAGKLVLDLPLVSIGFISLGGLAAMLRRRVKKGQKA